MSFWTAIVLICLICAVSESYRARLKKMSAHTKENFDDMSDRIARLEERMANLETIVLEKEKTRVYSEL